LTFTGAGPALQTIGGFRDAVSWRVKLDEAGQERTIEPALGGDTVRLTGDITENWKLLTVWMEEVPPSAPVNPT
jgi:hypothetical protein